MYRACDSVVPELCSIGTSRMKDGKETEEMASRRNFKGLTYIIVTVSF